MRKQQFQVGDRQVRCVPEPSRGATAGLKTACRVKLSAEIHRRLPAELKVTPPRLSPSLSQEKSRGKLLSTDYYFEDQGKDSLLTQRPIVTYSRRWLITKPTRSQCGCRSSQPPWQPRPTTNSPLPPQRLAHRPGGHSLMRLPLTPLPRDPRYPRRPLTPMDCRELLWLS